MFIYHSPPAPACPSVPPERSPRIPDQAYRYGTRQIEQNVYMIDKRKFRGSFQAFLDFQESKELQGNIPCSLLALQKVGSLLYLEFPNL